MAFDSSYPPLIPIQATGPRGQVSADPVEADGLSGSARAAECLNSLLVNHVGALAGEGFISTADRFGTAASGAYAFQLPWLMSLLQVDSQVQVWLRVVREPAITWTIDITTTVGAALGVNVNGGATTAGAWWLAATLPVDDTIALDGVNIAPNTFTGSFANSYIEAVSVLPAVIDPIANATVLSGLSKADIAPLDVAAFVGEEAAPTWALQWMASIADKVRRRGATAYDVRKVFFAALGSTVDFTVLILDDVPRNCTSATFRANVTARNGAGVSTLFVGGTAINVPAVGVYTLSIPVVWGEQTTLLVRGLNLRVSTLSLFYDEVP